MDDIGKAKATPTKSILKVTHQGAALKPDAYDCLVCTVSEMYW